MITSAAAARQLPIELLLKSIRSARSPDEVDASKPREVGVNVRFDCDAPGESPIA